MLNPTFTPQQIRRMDISSKMSIAYDKTTYLPGLFFQLYCLQMKKKEDFIGGVMVSMLASSVVDHELEHLACQSKTIHWHLLLSIQH